MNEVNNEKCLLKGSREKWLGKGSWPDKWLPFIKFIGPIKIESERTIKQPVYTKNSVPAEQGTTVGFIKKRLYSIKELVSVIGCTENYWRVRIWSGVLPFIQDGRKQVVDIEDVEKFISENKRTHLA